jgi:cold shock CspA family protein
LKAISEITFGFSDAENYRRRDQKDLFNKIFLRTDALDRLCETSTFFLVGEKGTGKTAYAVYMSSSPLQSRRNPSIKIKSTHKFIRETDYQKFIRLKTKDALTLSEYTDIWKVVIYVLLADAVWRSHEDSAVLFKNTKFVQLKKVLDDYYKNAFSPEIPVAMQLVENADAAVKMLIKAGAIELGGEGGYSESLTTNKQAFQTNLLAIQRGFEEAFSSIKLSETHLLFIDGVDIRPPSVPYSEYLDCVKGLANAVWSVNNDIFPRVRDSVGRLRTVLLLRPDIFNSLSLQNRNTKLRDNSVVLNWKTLYQVHRQSDLFALADRMFSAQQDVPPNTGDSWDYYFPFDATNVTNESAKFSSFILFLRYSFHRPRDILSMLDILRDLMPDGESATRVFEYKDLFTPDFRRAYGDYLLGEIKDSLSFYYDEEEVELFVKFFEYLDGSHRFNYDKYLDAFERFSSFLITQGRDRPSYMRTADEFLQFLYDQNILCFIERAEDESFIRWCFLERTPSNISPKVKIDVDYEIHYGLANALNTGKALRGRAKRVESETSALRSIGTVMRYMAQKKFGFIKQEGIPVDIFFHHSDVVGGAKVTPGQSVRFSLDKDKSGRLVAKSVEIKG